jgi:ribosomal protein S26
MDCVNCGKEIPVERLEVLPDTTTCVNCSTVTAKTGVVIWDKGVSNIVALNADEAERFSQLENADGRLGRLK